MTVQERLKFHLLFASVLFSTLLQGQGVFSLNPPNDNYNYFIHEDSFGFVWVSSANGWYRTDGSHFLHIPAGEPTDTLTSQLVQSPIYPDRNDLLWYAVENGLHSVNPVHLKQQTVRLQVDGRLLTNDYFILYLNKKLNRLWWKADQQLGYYDIDTGENFPLPLETRAARFTIDTFPDGQLRTIIGLPWLNAKGIELFTRQDITLPWQLTKPESLATNTLSSGVFLDPEQVLLASSDRELLIFNTHSGGKHLLSAVSKDHTPQVGVSDLKLKNDTVFASSPGEGLWAIIPPKALGEPFRCHLDTNFRANALSVDRSGRLWASVEGNGFFLKKKNTPHFSVLSSKIGFIDFLPVDDFHGLGLLSDGSIYTCDVENDQYKQIVPPDKTGDRQYRRLFSVSNYLFSTSQTQLHIIDRPTHRLLQKIPLSGKKNLEFCASSNGEIIVTTTQGVHQLRNETNGWELTPHPDFRDYPDWHLQSVGFTDHLFFKKDEDNILYFPRGAKHSATELSVGSFIQSISPGPVSGEYWTGTMDGLFFMSPAKKERPDLGIVNRENTSINTVIPQPPHHVLFSNNVGVYLYNNITKATHRYSKHDGLPGNIIRMMKAPGTRTKNIWVLTKVGPAIFNPFSLPRKNYAETTPYLAQIWVNNAPITSDTVLHLLKNLTLQYWEKNLKVSVANINLNNHNPTQVALQLSGQDTTWKIQLSGEPISFGNLPAGDHTLSYRSVDEHGQLSTTSVLHIKVLVPFWEQTWFRVSSILSLIGIGFLINFFIMRVQLRKSREAFRRQQAITAERDRIAAELHDDLGGDLASMAYIIDGHNSLKDLGVEADLDINRLGQLANGAIKHMREMIWVLDDEQATLPTLAKQLLANAREMAATGNLSLQADIPESLPELSLSSTQKKNILLIAKEAMQNIRKHAKASAFNLRLAVEQMEQQQTLVLTITDNGQGLTATQQTAGEERLNQGHGLKNLHKRAKEINANLTLSPALPRGTKVVLCAPIDQSKTKPILKI